MIEVSGTLTVAAIVEVADQKVAVHLPDTVLGQVAQNFRDSVELSSRIPTYGRTTGVGANKEIAAEREGEHGLRLLRSHAVDAGPLLPEREVRAMLAVRLNQLCVPGSGIEPEILPRLVNLLNDDALPIVKRFGAIGTADLTALAGTALTLLGERPATKPLTPMTGWSTESALPFISSSALTIGQACLASAELRQLALCAEVIYSLVFTALHGEPNAFAPPAVAAIASPGIVAVAARLEALLPSETLPTPQRIQDPYGLRIFPIVQATLIEALDRFESQLNALLGAAQENPLFDAAADRVVHHGAFFQSALALDADGLSLALSRAATMTHARIRLMNEPNQTGLGPFLASGASGSSGLMMVEYVAASALAEIRNSASPASNSTLSLSRGAEEDASFATQAVTQLQRAVAAQRVLLSSELIGALRLLRQSGVTSTLAARVSATCHALSTDDTDRDLRPDLEIADTLLEEIAKLNV